MWRLTLFSSFSKAERNFDSNVKCYSGTAFQCKKQWMTKFQASGYTGGMVKCRAKFIPYSFPWNVISYNFWFYARFSLDICRYIKRCYLSPKLAPISMPKQKPGNYKSDIFFSYFNLDQLIIFTENGNHKNYINSYFKFLKIFF